MNEKTARPNLKELAKGMTLSGSPYDTLSEADKKALVILILKDVKEIESIPSEYHKEVADMIFQCCGNLPELVPYLQKINGISLQEAREIANEQTKRLFSNLNIIRLQALSMDKYKWLYVCGANSTCSEDHESMGGKIYSLGSPPVIDSKTGKRGHPGQVAGCLCQICPIISFD